MLIVKSILLKTLIFYTMKLKRKLLKTKIFVLLLALTNVVSAQQNSISGRVLDNENKPLPGATIVVKGTTVGTVSESDGTFQLQIPSDAETLVISFVGMVTQEIPIEGKSNFEIILRTEAYGLDEVLVTGYQTQKRVDVTGAIDVVESETLSRSSASNPLVALQGQMPGAYVTTSGAPGAGVNIIIRGLSTLGNNNPLYIIDGIPTKSGIDNIDASSIENIQILKDAAASSIYGSRASNGVIIIETKKGTQNQISFDSRVTTQKYQSKISVLNTEERGIAMWRALINEGIDPSSHALYDYEWNQDYNNPDLSRVIVKEWISEELGIKSADTDWWDEVTRPGLILRNELTMSTGGAAGGSRLTLTQYKNQGVFINDDFNKFNVSLNSHYKFKDIIEIGENLVVTSSVRYPDHVRGGALSTQSIIPVYTEDGGWGGPWGAGFEDWLQPVADSYLNSWDNTQSERIMGSGYMQINFMKNLSLRSTVGVEYSNSTWTDYQRPYVSGFLHRDIANLTINKNNSFNWSLSNTLNYNIEIDRHSVSFLGGVELFKNTDNWLNTFADDFASDEKDYYQMDAAVGTQTVSGNKTGYQLLSFFGKINYNFSDKYLLTATLRYDGSSRFGAENRFGTFPSVSAGWRLDQESFIKDNFEFIDLLKPRYGYGVVGNQEIGNDAAIALYEALYGMDYTWDWDRSTSYDISGNDSGTLPSGFRRVKADNPILKWETTTENNAGLDFGFLDMKFTGSLDYYMRKSKDILIQPPYMAAIGEGGYKWYNGATVENKGWELTLKYRNSKGDLDYVVSANAGHFNDKITYLPEEVVRAYVGNVEQTILGRSQRALFGYVADGLFQNQAEVDSHAQQTGKDIGRIRFADLNDDGVINDLDQKFQGNTLPGLIYGINANLTYKNWDVNFFFNGEMDKNVYNSTKQYTDFMFTRAGVNYGKRVLDAWTPQNPESEIPAVITSNKNNEFRTSSYFIEKGGYIKLRNVELNYNFDTTNRLRFFKNLRIYVIGENLVMVKHKSYTGPDPENPNNSYSRPLTFTLGVNFSL
jgi:TonB-linked SusC/RagA family outer membrane protein